MFYRRFFSLLLAITFTLTRFSVAEVGQASRDTLLRPDLPRNSKIEYPDHRARCSFGKIRGEEGTTAFLFLRKGPYPTTCKKQFTAAVSTYCSSVTGSNAILDSSVEDEGNSCKYTLRLRDSGCLEDAVNCAIPLQSPRVKCVSCEPFFSIAEKMRI